MKTITTIKNFLSLVKNALKSNWAHNQDKPSAFLDRLPSWRGVVALWWLARGGEFALLLKEEDQWVWNYLGWNVTDNTLYYMGVEVSHPNPRSTRNPIIIPLPWVKEFLLAKWGFKSWQECREFGIALRAAERAEKERTKVRRSSRTPIITPQ